MIKKILLVSLCWLSFSLLAEEKTEVITGNGQYFSEENESIINIKDQLIHSAFKDIFNKALVKLNLNSEEFWKKYETDFERSFKPIQNSLMKTYHEGDPKQTEAQKTEYQQKLKEARNREYKNFGGIAKIIQTFSVKELNKDPNQPLSRSMILEAKVKVNNVFKIYDEFSGTTQKSSFDKLYISIDFDLNADTTIYGVKDLEEIAKVVTKSWSDYLKQNGSNTFREIIVINSSNVNNYNDSSSIAWLKIGVKALGYSENRAKMTREFTFEMRGLVVDLSNNQPIYAFDKNIIKENFEVNNDLSSKIATTFYRMPLKNLKEFKDQISSSNRGEERESLIVQNYRNFSALDKIKDIILQKTLKYRSSVSVRSFTLGDVELIIEFSGDKDQFKKDLVSLNNSNFIDQGEYLIKVVSQENPVTLAIEPKLTQNGTEVKPAE
ncbi:MAG: hypothetical protein U0T83_01635 [Bacteriovoracaceae bacterium]